MFVSHPINRIIVSYFSAIIFVLSDFFSLKESTVAMKEREDQERKNIKRNKIVINCVTIIKK